jgi:hypothetical protein
VGFLNGKKIPVVNFDRDPFFHNGKRNFSPFPEEMQSGCQQTATRPRTGMLIQTPKL